MMHLKYLVDQLTHEPYSQLTIMAQGIVELNVNNSLGVDLAHISPAMFLQPTDRTLCNTEMQCFAHQYAPTPTSKLSGFG